MSPPDRQCIVCDIGGTNARFALYDHRTHELGDISVYKTADFNSLEDALSHWLQMLDHRSPDVCTVAVAAPPSGDRVAMLNCNWTFSCRELADRFSFRRFRVLNDFEANAHSLPYLADHQLLSLYPGVVRGGRLATLGPGTGLGGACLAQLQGVHISLACEPGHMELAPGGALEKAIFERLTALHDYIYAELLVSGPGLVRLYTTIGDLEGVAVDPLKPDEISAHAVSGDDERCERALQVFCGLLGSICGNFMLANGSYGGLYIAGGIVPRITGFLQNSTFHERMMAKGAMRETLAEVPVYVITSGQPGLIGAARAPWL